jgi:hypothetical protein
MFHMIYRILDFLDREIKIRVTAHITGWKGYYIRFPRRDNVLALGASSSA